MATPLDWDELGRTRPQSYTIRNLFQRLGQKTDPWEGLQRHARSLQSPKKRLGGLLEESEDG